MDSLKKVIDEMRESVKFNRTPFYKLPPEFRVEGCIAGEAVVARYAVANRVDVWVDRLEKIRERLKESVDNTENENG